MPLFEVKNLSVWHGEQQVLFDINLDITQGSCVSLLGANGVGKSSFLLSIFGLVDKVQGVKKYQGADIHPFSVGQLIQKGLVLVPESRELFNTMTVKDHLNLACWSSKKPWESVLDLFPELKDLLKQYVGTLSGGEKQMLALARAMLLDPKLLLLDEPSFGLAPKNVAKVFSLIHRIKQEGVTILMVEQNVVRALELSDHAYLLSGGRILLDGKASELSQREDIVGMYLGGNDQ